MTKNNLAKALIPTRLAIKSNLKILYHIKSIKLTILASTCHIVAVVHIMRISVLKNHREEEARSRCDFGQKEIFEITTVLNLCINVRSKKRIFHSIFGKTMVVLSVLLLLFVVLLSRKGAVVSNCEVPKLFLDNWRLVGIYFLVQ